MISPKEYDKIVKKNSPKSKCFVNSIKAFLIGGGICVLGQIILNIYKKLNLDEDTAKTVTSVTLSPSP